MKKVHLALFLVLVLTFSYQNCQQSNYGQDNNLGLTADNGNQAIGSATDINGAEKIILANESISEITFLSYENIKYFRGQTEFTVKANKYYSIDLETGVVLSKTDLDNIEVRNCLTAELLNELNTFLSQSKICKGQTAISEDKVCTQQYKSGYAQLKTNIEIYDLGSASDSCGSNMLDLCDDGSTQLKSIFEKIKKQLSVLNCQE